MSTDYISVNCMTDSTKLNPTAWCNIWACCQHLKWTATRASFLVGRTYCSRGYGHARGCMPIAQLTLRAGQRTEYSRSASTTLPRNVNVKVIFSVPTPRRLIGTKEVYLHSFLTSALDGGEWLTSLPINFTCGKYLSPVQYEAGWAPARIRTPDHPCP